MTIQQLHTEAMNAADDALLAARRGQLPRAKKLHLKAFELERQSAELAVKRKAKEPTRSVLLRSAGTLALRCGEVREAERLVAIALSGNPPAEIADELRDLLEEVHFARHLELRGLVLGEDELQFSIAGPAVAPGVAPTEDLVRRIETFQTLVYRTAEHREGRPYREGAGAPQPIRRDFQLWVSHARAASFAVTLRLSRSAEQLELDNTPARDLIDDLFQRLEYYDAGQEEQLKKAIREEAYLNNFLALAKQLAPTGKTIRMVGLTALRDGKEKRLQLTRTRSGSKPGESKEATAAKPKPNTLRGILKAADSLKEAKSRIRIVDDDGKVWTVGVAPGMMEDIVRPFWGAEVVIEVQRGPGSSLILEDVQGAEDEESKSPAENYDRPA